MQTETSIKSRDTVRINLEVSPQVRDHIKILRDKSNATTQAEVFRRALAVYDMILDHTAAGGKIVLESANGDREVVKLI